jgi:hypothetical protein
MANFAIHKVTALPGSLASNAIYIVSTSAPFAEIYITDTAGTARRVPNTVDIQGMINTSLSGLTGGTTIVNTIADRNALVSPTNGMLVLVIDASADVNVTLGAATYVYRTAGAVWIKISEAESLDVTASWAALTGKPTSSPTDIDAAVTQRHTHTNKTQLDQIGQDANGNLTYNNILPVIAWGSTGW